LINHFLDVFQTLILSSIEKLILLFEQLLFQTFRLFLCILDLKEQVEDLPISFLLLSLLIISLLSVELLKHRLEARKVGLLLGIESLFKDLGQFVLVSALLSRPLVHLLEHLVEVPVVDLLGGLLDDLLLSGKLLVQILHLL